MDFTVPDSVKRTLGEFEGRQRGFREFDLSQAIENLAKQPATLPDAERRGVWVAVANATVNTTATKIANPFT
jgi:hypothetical protein